MKPFYPNGSEDPTPTDNVLAALTGFAYALLVWLLIWR